MRKRVEWIWVVPSLIASVPEARGVGAAYLGWRAARFAMLIATLPLLPFRLLVVVLALVVLALTGIARGLYDVLEYANAPRRFLTRKLNERAGDIRAIRRRMKEG